MNKQEISVKDLVMTGLWIAMVTVTTMIFFPLPGQGYFNLGDSAVFLGVYLLGRRNGTIAAGIGAALADVILGYTVFAPFTLVIKALMAFIFGSFLLFSEGKVKSKSKKVPVSSVLGIGLAIVVLVGGYYMAEWLISGSSTAPLLAIPWNILQGMLGGFIALMLIAGIRGIRMPKKEVKEHKSPVQSTGKLADQEPVEEVEAEIVSPERDGISK